MRTAWQCGQYTDFLDLIGRVKSHGAYAGNSSVRHCRGECYSRDLLVHVLDIPKYSELFDQKPCYRPRSLRACLYIRRSNGIPYAPSDNTNHVHLTCMASIGARKISNVDSCGFHLS